MQIFLDQLVINKNHLKMKNLLFVLTILFSTIMMSCGSAEVSTDNTDSIDSVEMVDSIATDTIAIDSIW